MSGQACYAADHGVGHLCSMAATGGCSSDLCIGYDEHLRRERLDTVSIHCRHCEEDCQGGMPIPAWPYPEPHTNDCGAEWPKGYCPACAEAERIRNELRAEADKRLEGSLRETDRGALAYAEGVQRGLGIALDIVDARW